MRLFHQPRSTPQAEQRSLDSRFDGFIHTFDPGNRENGLLLMRLARTQPELDFLSNLILDPTQPQLREVDHNLKEIILKRAEELKKINDLQDALDEIYQTEAKQLIPREANSTVGTAITEKFTQIPAILTDMYLTDQDGFSKLQRSVSHYQTLTTERNGLEPVEAEQWAAEAAQQKRVEQMTEVNRSSLFQSVFSVYRSLSREGAERVRKLEKAQDFYNENHPHKYIGNALEDEQAKLKKIVATRGEDQLIGKKLKLLRTFFQRRISIIDEVHQLIQDEINREFVPYLGCSSDIALNRPEILFRSHQAADEGFDSPNHVSRTFAHKLTSSYRDQINYELDRMMQTNQLGHIPILNRLKPLFQYQGKDRERIDEMVLRAFQQISTTVQPTDRRFIPLRNAQNAYTRAVIRRLEEEIGPRCESAVLTGVPLPDQIAMVKRLLEEKQNYGPETTQLVRGVVSWLRTNTALSPTDPPPHLSTKARKILNQIVI
ncbi:hypothetical protein KGQ71_01450 [Patescibacteria group bacterium]|nr:hypothetical protein [Patescibacteria group bacterium]